MSKILSGVFMGLIVMMISSCGNVENKIVVKKTGKAKQVVQQADGSISLKVEKAECYHDITNPATNTAEWNVFVSKSGRFDVWISSATKDTTDLQYKSSVMLSIMDSRLEARPACDKIIQNSSDVQLPYFRADSFMGEVYIQDTGSYNIQLISEKILPANKDVSKESVIENSKLISVSLTPITR
jgi:hypothetical protein